MLSPEERLKYFSNYATVAGDDANELLKNANSSSGSD